MPMLLTVRCPHNLWHPKPPFMQSFDFMRLRSANEALLCQLVTIWRLSVQYNAVHCHVAILTVIEQGVLCWWACACACPCPLGMLSTLCPACPESPCSEQAMACAARSAERKMSRSEPHCLIVVGQHK